VGHDPGHAGQPKASAADAAEQRQRQADRRAKVEAYKAVERAEAEALAGPSPRVWRFALRMLVSKFLIQNDANYWMTERRTLIRPEHTLVSWPFNEIPDAATLDALYEECWAEIIRERRYRGP
jgi:hypothetical protein